MKKGQRVLVDDEGKKPATFVRKSEVKGFVWVVYDDAPLYKGKPYEDMVWADTVEPMDEVE